MLIRGGHRYAGMTLTELVVVVGLIGVVTGLTTVKLGGPSANIRSRQAFVRSIYYSMLETRAEVMADGHARYWQCKPKICIVWRHDTAGRPPAGSTAWTSQRGALVNPGSSIHFTAIVYGSTYTTLGQTFDDTDRISNTYPKTLSFDIDGRCGYNSGGNSGATLYMHDPNTTSSLVVGPSIDPDELQKHRYKIAVYGATCLPRLIEGW